ncbi:MAG: hypothetical protein WDO69_05145 [Pseudomonadota bacterium]
MKSRLCSVRLACALALSAPIVIVQTRASAQDSANDANAQYRKAFEALDRKNWPEARRLLLPLWSKAHTWDVAAGLGQAEFLLENHATGATYTAFALANLPPKEKTKTAERLRAALSEMKEAVGTVHLAVNVDGAEILVEQEIVGTSPLAREVYLNPGTRLLQARLANGALSRQTLEVEAGKSYEVALSVEPSLNGQQVAVAPLESADETAHATLPVHDDRAAPNWAPVLVTGGLAVAAAAIGTGFAIDASSAKSDGSKALAEAESQFGNNPCAPSKGAGSEICRSVHDAEDRRKRSNTVATASFIAGGIFAVAAVGSYFLWAKKASPRLDAWLGPDGGGLGLNGSF